MAGHTPTPWRIDGREFKEYGMSHIGCGHYIVAHALGQTSTSQLEAEANASFIVRAVNAHDDLVKALNLALEYWAHRQQRYKNRSPEWVMQARASLAKAGGANG